MTTRPGMIVVFLAATLTGCSGVSQAQIDEAKSLVTEGLETWKKGGKPSDLKSLPRPVEFHEASWGRGDALLSYELTRAYYHAGTRVIRCEVKLTLQARRARTRLEEVAYEVTLGSPARVVLNPMP